MSSPTSFIAGAITRGDYWDPTLQRLTSRLEKLEQARAPCGLICFAWNGVEDRNDCIRGYGYDPEAEGMTYILVDPTDQRL